MISCKQATQLVSTGLDQKLSLSQRISLKLHLFICHYCRTYVRHLNFLRRATGRLEQHIEQQGQPLSAKAREKVKQSIKNNH
jgi:hypothetical protein